MSAGEDIRRLLRDGPLRRGQPQKLLPWYAKKTIHGNLTQLRKMGLIEKTKTSPFVYRLPNI